MSGRPLRTNSGDRHIRRPGLHLKLIGPAAMSGWLHVVSHPDGQNLDSAGEPTDGFTYTAFALSDLAGGTCQDERFAEVRRIADAQLSGGQPL
jgi:hypothetical protein